MDRILPGRDLSDGGETGATSRRDETNSAWIPKQIISRGGISPGRDVAPHSDHEAWEICRAPPRQIVFSDGRIFLPQEEG